MSSIPSMRSLDTRPLERAVERGRARMESLAETISNEGVAEFIEELRQDAAPIIERAVPMIERATKRRRRRRKPQIALALLALSAVAAVIAYLLWQRRDEEPAYLMHSPDLPDLTPAGTPPSDSPSAGPAEPEPAPERASSPFVDVPDVAPSREFASTPRAHFGFPDAREERTADVGHGLPGSQQMPFAASRVELPGNARRPWLPR
ncbi:MAG: hypothetical protein WC273_01975 [Dehalococcoidia bacterium]